MSFIGEGDTGTPWLFQPSVVNCGLLWYSYVNSAAGVNVFSSADISLCQHVIIRSDIGHILFCIFGLLFAFFHSFVMLCFIVRTLIFLKYYDTYLIIS